MAVLTFEVTKEAIKLIKMGKAVLSSGGVRDNAGRLIELARPTAVDSVKQLLHGFPLSPGTAAINVASSLTANVQSAFIQHSVNIANAKLDDVISRLGAISKAMNGLNTIQTLSWVNATFGLANCGISIAGFYMTMQKMENIHGQIHDFFDRYRQDRQSDRVQEYDTILMNLKADLAYIAQLHKEDAFDRQVFEIRAEGIEKDLNDARAFLIALMEDFQARRIDGQMGCEMIFTLLAVYSQLFNEYACWYYYVRKTQHALYVNWYEPLNKIDAPAIRKALGEWLTFSPAYATISQTRKIEALKIAYEGVSQQKERIQACQSAIENLSMSDFAGIDPLMNQQVTECIATDLLKISTSELDNLITQRIIETELEEDDNDRVLIPVYSE